MWVVGVDGAAVLFGLIAVGLISLRVFRSGRSLVRALGDLDTGPATDSRVPLNRNALGDERFVSWEI